MFLPDLDIKLPELSQSCIGKDRCLSCRFFQVNRGPCKGCNPDCRMARCQTQCGRCGGNVVDVPAVCCKSPKSYQELLFKPIEREYKWHEVEPIKLKSRAVIVTIGGRSSVFKPGESPYYPGIGAVAVNLRHVWSARNGWYSQDMKDYMGVPSDVKLVLLTAGYDDTLDRAWVSDLFDGFGEVGFDYWAPILFSTYNNDAKMNGQFNYLRSLYSLWRSKAHFCPDPPKGFASTDFTVMTSAIKNVAFNVQLTDSTEIGLRVLASSAFNLHKMTHPEATIWAIGARSPKIVSILHASMPGRTIYCANTNVWLASHKGELYTRLGKTVMDRSISKRDVILQSQENFVRMIGDARKKVAKLESIAKRKA